MINSRLSRRTSEAAMSLTHGVCDACGAQTYFTFKPVITSQLARQWGMTKSQQLSMSMRESMYCMFCGSSYRLRLLARAINYVTFGNANLSLQQRIDTAAMDDLRIAEINSCGVLHEILRKAPKLSYSEYVPVNPDIQHQDIEQLTYRDAEFDIVLTSDVLEHVPDVRQALRETYRVLKPGGAHIMTVPLLMDRKTKLRAKRHANGSLTHVSPPSHHGSGEDDYLVWSEFGYDFIDMCREVGFATYYLFQNKDNSDDISGVVIAIRPGNNKNLVAKLPQADKKANFDPAWGDLKLSELKNKIELTIAHANNLQALLDAHIEDNKKKASYIQELESRGIRYHLKRKLSETSRRRDRQ